MGLLCRICGSDNLEQFPRGATQLIRCRNCAVVFNAEMPSAASVSEFYRKAYTLTADERALAAERRRIYRLPEQVKLMARIAAIKPAPARILDVGCDRGYFLDEARRYGYQVQGVELSEEARAYTDAIRIPVASSLGELDGDFDVVTMWHSLEHFVDPLPFLKALREKMPDGGAALIRVPDFGCAWSSVLKSRWGWFQPRNHCFHYTRESLQNTLKYAGFGVISVVSQRPNNMLTRRANRLGRTMFGRYWHSRPSVRRRLADWYEDVTCHELFAIARK